MLASLVDQASVLSAPASAVTVAVIVFVSPMASVSAVGLRRIARTWARTVAAVGIVPLHARSTASDRPSARHSGRRTAAVIAAYDIRTPRLCLSRAGIATSRAFDGAASLSDGRPIEEHRDLSRCEGVGPRLLGGELLVV